MKKKPRLLILTSSFPSTLVDQTCGYIRELAVELSSQFEVTVLTPACSASSHSREREGMAVIRFHHLFPRRFEVLDSVTDHWTVLSRGVWARLSLIFYMASFFLQALHWGRQTDVLLSHWMLPAGLLGSGVSWVLRKPHVVIEHSGGLRLLHRIPLGQWLARFILGGCEKIITVSHELRSRLLELTPEAQEKVEVIPMGVYTKSFNDTKGNRRYAVNPRKINGHRVVLYLGRLSPVKGVTHLVEAMSGIDQAVLVIAGEGEDELALRGLAHRKQIRSLFLGQVDERLKRLWLERAHLVVIPSMVLRNGRTEGLPVVCLEALAAGKPVIASRVGGLPEVVRDGENGFLVEPANVAQLQTAIKLLLEDQELHDRISHHAQLSSQPYDWATIGQKYYRAIEAAIFTHRLRKRIKSEWARDSW